MSTLVTREELLKNYEYVTKVSLVQCMSDSHIRVLREDIDNWKQLMTGLGFSQSELELIDLQEDMEVMKRHAALHKWKRQFGRRATYLNFLNACMKAKNVALAERMLDLFNEHLKELAEQQTSRENQLTSPSRSAHHHNTSNIENESDFLALSYTSISSRGSVGSSGLGEWLPIDQRIEELKMKYRSTLEILSDHFQSSVAPEATMKNLTLMPSEIKNLKSYQQVINTKSEYIFAELIAATDYRHFEVLQQLVSDLGDSTCKTALLLYQEDLKNFRTETLLRELSDGWPGSNLAKGDNDIILHMGDKWETKTLHDLKELKNRIQRKARFSIHDLQTQKVEQACLCVTLATASTSADVNNLKLIEPDFFKSNNVLRVSVGDKVIYNVESPKHYKFISSIPSHFLCPITKQIMLEPHKTTCCGRHVSKETVEHCRLNNEPCPFCKVANLEFRKDQVLQERTQAVRIYCPYKHENCHWEGEIRFLLKHLQSDEICCLYALRSCPYSCGSYTQRLTIKKHLLTCKVFNAPLQCEYCSMEYSRTTPHQEDCPKAPVSCPYQCGETLERGRIAAHLKVCLKLQIKQTQRRSMEETDSGQDHTNTLVNIARQMLHIRCELPDIWVENLQQKIHLAELTDNINRSGHEDEGEDVEEVKERAEALKERGEYIKSELEQLRVELHRVHREKDSPLT